MVSTVTLYRSPVRLIEHASEDAGSYSSQAISRARKKMMAEISLAGDEIVIDNVAYSRNDASTLLDFITESNWKSHSIIYAQKGMLNFLEKEEFNNEELKKADAYLYHSGFVQAVSPYFAHSFNSISGKLLRQENFAELVQLLNYQGYVLPEHHHEAYQKIRTCLDELNYTLRNLSWEKFAADESILHFIFSDEWKQFINKLPSSFTALRDELVEQMTGIVLRFQHKATWYYLHQVLVQMKMIETNDFNRSEVERIDKIIYENSRIEGGRGKRTISNNDGEVSTGRIIWWAIWIILIIVRVATCSSRNSSSNKYSFDEGYLQEVTKVQERSAANRSTEQHNEKTLLDFFDSLSHKKNLPVEPLYTPIRTGDQPFNSFANLPQNTGPSAVTIINNTPHNCVMIYFDGPSIEGSVYREMLSNTVAVYIKKGESYTFNTEPSKGSIHFLFGDEWSRLKQTAEHPLIDNNKYSVRQKILIYEFFKPDRSIVQKYLKKGIRLEYPSDRYYEEEYLYLHKPNRDSAGNSVELTLQKKDNKISVKASGGLAVKENKRDSPFDFSEELKEARELINSKQQ